MSAGTELGLETIPPVRVDPAEIERELRRLEEDGNTRELPVTRACMSNLLVYCDDEAQAEGLPGELGELVERHPARILLLVGEGTGIRSGIEAEVSALCYLGSGGRQVCAEHVRLRAAAGARRSLAPTARPLLIGDLPTALWWATSVPPPAGELFHELSGMAHQVIYDSVGWRDPVHGVISAADWSAASRGTRRVCDLAWSRLSPWRRLVAEALDPARLPGGIEGIVEIELEHGPHGLSQAWLLIGWLARCLGWRAVTGKVQPGTQVSFAFESLSGPLRATLRRRPEGSARIREISIRAGVAGSEAVVCLTTLDPGRLSICVEGAASTESAVVLPGVSRAALLSAQLSERSADPLFYGALDTSRDLARAVLE